MASKSTWIFLTIFSILIILFVIPTTSGSPYQTPIVNDWLHNSTSESRSHVPNYSVKTPDKYFSGDQPSAGSVEDRLNNSSRPNIVEIYRVNDPLFIKYPTGPVYQKWNENNPYDYNRRPYTPEFKKGKTSEGHGSDPWGFSEDSNKYVIRDGWAGIYSIQPSVYAHTEPGESQHLVGDTITVIGIVSADKGKMPSNRTEGNGEGALRYNYTFDRIEYSAQLIIAGHGVVKSTVVSQNVAEFNSVNIGRYLNPGETTTLIIRGSATVRIQEDVDKKVEKRVEVPCDTPTPTETPESEQTESEQTESDSDPTPTSTIPPNRPTPQVSIDKPLDERLGIDTDSLLSPPSDSGFDTSSITIPFEDSSTSETQSGNPSYSGVSGGLHKSQSTPCYEEKLVWKDKEENVVTETIRMTDSQPITYPKSFHAGNINNQVTYKRGVYPNGTTEIYLDFSSVPGTVAEKGPWRMIKIGNQEIYSGWRIWSSRNMSWDIMYKSNQSSEQHLSHVRPLAFHIAPTEPGLTGTENVEFTRNSYATNSKYYRPGLGEREIKRYTSPVLRTHRTCRRLYPEHVNNPSQAKCGWWVFGARTNYSEINSPPYFKINERGYWQVNDRIFIEAPNAESTSNVIEVYGLLPNQRAEIEPDRTVQIKKTNLYAEIIEKNYQPENGPAWIKVRFTLVEAESKNRISTEGRPDEALIVDGTKKSGNSYTASSFDTNQNGEVVVKIYRPAEYGIQAHFKTEDWRYKSDGEQAYLTSRVDREVAVPAFTVGPLLRSLIAMLTVFWLISHLSVRFMSILQIGPESTREQLKDLFPGEWWRPIIYATIIFIILSAL